MRQAQINVRTRACSRTSIARTKQAALTHNVRGKELNHPVALMSLHQPHLQDECLSCSHKVVQNSATYRVLLLCEYDRLCHGGSPLHTDSIHRGALDPSSMAAELSRLRKRKKQHQITGQGNAIYEHDKDACYRTYLS